MSKALATLFVILLGVLIVGGFIAARTGAEGSDNTAPPVGAVSATDSVAASRVEQELAAGVAGGSYAGTRQGLALLDELTSPQRPADLNRQPLDLTPETIRHLNKAGLRQFLLKAVRADPGFNMGQGEAGGSTVNIVADRDNTLYESDTGDLSNGAGPHVYVGKTGVETLRRAVMRFDIAGLLNSGSTVTGVTLMLHLSLSAPGNVSQPIELHSLTSDWGEGTSDSVILGGGMGAPATTGDATWIHTFFSNSTWTTSGGDYSPTVTASQNAADPGCYEWSSAQMIANVQDWLDNPGTNYGWILIGNEVEKGTAKRFDSRENATASFRPTLSVTVEVGDSTPPTVEVLSPNGGESLDAEVSTMVSWTATDPSGMAYVDVFASFDNGVTYSPIALGLAGGTTSVKWFPPIRPTTDALIKVEATDNFLNTAADESDGGFTILVPADGLVATTLTDFDQPGSQPFEHGLQIRDPDTDCAGCHGNFATPSEAEPYFYWRGSMMANASRDPLFEAALAVANQDAPASGDLCIRCHTPKAWFNGRSTPTSGSEILPDDRFGVSCDVCHRMVDPIFDVENPVEDEEILAGILDVPTYFGTGRMVLDFNGLRRGPTNPLDLVQPNPHQVVESPFHREAALCGTCHNVSNPLFVNDGLGNYVLNDLNTPTEDFSPGNVAPIERTYSEWLHSEYNTPEGVFNPDMGGNKDFVSTCQDCHMRDVGGKSCSLGNDRPDMPQHDLTGGSTWMMGLLADLYPADIDPAAQADAIERGRFMLQNAAELVAVVDGDKLTVTVTNNTGHKLPTGYPEGRRMWLNVQFYDSGDELIGESGAYDSATGELTHDVEVKIYEAEHGLDQAMADATGLTAGPSFHFVLNNKIYKDNRIPPRGFTNENFASFGGAPVDYSYADGQYWDDTIYTIPAGVSRVEIALYYQSTSREYVEFLRDENHTNSKGDEMFALWNENGKSPPELMESVTVLIGPTTWYVDDDGTCPGTGCQGDPFCMIQPAIDASSNRDEIVVAPGIYFENINFNGKAITLRSTDPTDPGVVAGTIIDGGGAGSVVTCNSSEGPGTVLDGFTITGGSASSGGGMSNTIASSPTVSRCVFTMNEATSRGGGMYNHAGSSPTITNCTFSFNEADRGGGMSNLNKCNPTVTNCLFIANTSIGVGGGMDNDNNSHPIVTHCTFSRNTASAGGAIRSKGTGPTVTNCILWGNSPNEIANNSGAMTIVSFSDVQGGLPAGTIDDGGNINADPMFADADGPDNQPATEDYDLRLLPGSPCIDAADNTAVPADTADIDGDGDTVEQLPLDLDGHAHFADDPATVDTGNPPEADTIVDMGPYEYIAGDGDGDGDADLLDYATFLSCVTAPGGSVPAECIFLDMDADGDVDLIDLDLFQLAFTGSP